jgi:hypothetical protein
VQPAPNGLAWHRPAATGLRQLDLLNAITFAWLAALGRPARRNHAQSFGINKQSLGTSPNSKTLPRRHIEAIPDRRSQSRRLPFQHSAFGQTEQCVARQADEPQQHDSSEEFARAKGPRREQDRTTSRP